MTNNRECNRMEQDTDEKIYSLSKKISSAMVKEIEKAVDGGEVDDLSLSHILFSLRMAWRTVQVIILGQADADMEMARNFLKKEMEAAIGDFQDSLQTPDKAPIYQAITQVKEAYADKK